MPNAEPSFVTNGTKTVTYTYEPGRNAVTSITNKVGTTTVSAYTYANNAFGQRTARSQTGAAFSAAASEVFSYNAKGEVTSTTHSTTAARNTAFAYDGIGNRNTAPFAGGNTTNYTANVLNQYTEVDAGIPAVPTYDDDGNMLTDGAGKNLIWDGENRLIEVRDGSNNLIATYMYDGQSRRVKKVTTSLAPQGVTEEVYIYGGWNRIATYTIQNSTFTIQNSHTWGRDLSGTLEGAGGVGGLLGISNLQSSISYAVAYDANGNVSEVIDDSGSVAAHYEYDPFGNIVVATGSYVSANPWRFSTKPVDQETGYSYYGYRFYNPETGRWVNRDPIEEEGGFNLYGMVGNNPANRIDLLGLYGGPDNPDIGNPITLATVIAFFASGDELAGKMLWHYFGGSGSLYTLSKSQLKKIDFMPGFSAYSYPKFLKTADEALKGRCCLMVDEESRGFIAGGYGNNALGGVTLTLRGKVCPSKGSKSIWEFDGSFQLKDYYNFDAGKNRGFWGEAKTALGANLLRGRSFPVESSWIPAKAKLSSSEFIW